MQRLRLVLSYLCHAKPHSYALDATFDYPDDVPEDVKTNKRYAGVGSYTISEVADQVAKDFGKIDVLVHSLANGPEVQKPLMQYVAQPKSCGAIRSVACLCLRHCSLMRVPPATPRPSSTESRATATLRRLRRPLIPWCPWRKSSART